MKENWKMREFKDEETVRIIRDRREFDDSEELEKDDKKMGERVENVELGQFYFNRGNDDIYVGLLKILEHYREIDPIFYWTNLGILFYPTKMENNMEEIILDDEMENMIDCFIMDCFDYVRGYKKINKVEFNTLSYDEIYDNFISVIDKYYI